MSSSELLQKVNEWIDAGARSTRKDYKMDGPINAAESSLICQEKVRIQGIVKRLALDGKFLGGFLSIDVMRFGNRDGKLIAIVTSLGSRTVYNDVRTTERTRAADIVSKFILHYVPALLSDVTATGATELGIVVAYGHRGPSDQFWDKGETIVFVVSLDACKKFAAADIAEEDLLNQAEFFMINGTELKKVRIEP
jgi:hypothetical protein